ncbi:MAG: hypothetical protein WC728_17420 [Elusimicrobiota bacterium]
MNAILTAILLSCFAAAQETGVREAIRDKEVPKVSGKEVPLTTEQKALLIEASMKLEEDMVQELRKLLAEWQRTKTPEEAARLLREAIELMGRSEKYKELFGDPSVPDPEQPDVWEETTRAMERRCQPGAPGVQNPDRRQITEALGRQGQDSASVQSAGSAQEVYEKHKALFAQVCEKYAGVDGQGAGFPRAILGILYAETNFGAGCDRASSPSCGSPSPVSKAMNGAQRNAAFRVGAKGVFGPWSATTGPASSAGAAGFCQFLPGTAEMHLPAYQRDFGGGAPNLFSFEGCIPMIAIYLKDYLDSHSSRRPGIENAVRAYNGGAGFKEGNSETSNYHRKVTGSMRAQTGVPETCREVLAQKGR